MHWPARCGNRRIERYRCKDGARRARTKSKLPRVAVAALHVRDLKSDLLPMLFGVTFLFGQFHESRQFNALIQVLIPVLLSAFRRMLDLGQGAVLRS